MAIVWTKYWAGSDDGTILKGIDLRNIQDDLAVVQTVDDVLTIPGQTQGDLLYYNGATWVKLGAGTDGQVLQTKGSGANPEWGDLTTAGSPTEGDIVYFDGTDWVALSPGAAGEVLTSNGAGVAPTYEEQSVGSNVIYAWTGYDARTNDLERGMGTYRGYEQTPVFATGELQNFFYARDWSNAANYLDLFAWKWTKAAGIDTLTVNARAWTTNTDITSAYLRLELDSGTATGDSANIITATSPGWITPFTCDVSGLTNGTTYDIAIQAGSADNAGTVRVYLSAITVEGS